MRGDKHAPGKKVGAQESLRLAGVQGSGICGVAAQPVGFSAAWDF